MIEVLVGEVVVGVLPGRAHRSLRPVDGRVHDRAEVGLLLHDDSRRPWSDAGSATHATPDGDDLGRAGDTEPPVSDLPGHSLARHDVAFRAFASLPPPAELPGATCWRCADPNPNQPGREPPFCPAPVALPLQEEAVRPIQGGRCLAHESGERFDREPAGSDGEQQQGSGNVAKNLFGRQSSALPVAEVVDDQDSAGREAVVEMLQLMPGRLYQSVSNRSSEIWCRREAGNGLLHQARVVVDQFLRVRRLPHALLHVVKPGNGPDPGGPCRGWRAAPPRSRRSPPSPFSVGGGIPSKVSKRWSRRSVTPCSIRASAKLPAPAPSPDTALHDVAGDAAPRHIPCRLDETEELPR